MDFRGRTVIVSGAASGIGMATAAVFGDRGARVVGVDAVAPPGPLAAEFHRVDLRGAGVAEGIVRLAGTVDVVCNVAGGHPPVEDRVRWQATVETPAWRTEGVGAEWVNRTPLRRPGHPDDVARVIAFLASDDAAYVTGTCLIVDGGMSVAGGPDSA